jgi:serine/threonine-protein kinase
MLMGTPVYMSPEQCRGTKSVDLRSDVYSLGIILYEMLVGRPPFVSEGFGDLVNMHLNVEPAPVRSWLPSIPEDVERLVQRALAKNPDDRFQTMAALQEALKALSGPGLVVRGSSPDLGSVPPRVATDPTMAAPPVRTTFSTGTGEMRTGGRSRGFKGLLVMVAATAVTVGGVGYYLRDRGPGERVGSEKVGASPGEALPNAATQPATAVDAAAERTGAPDVSVNKTAEQPKPPAVLKGQPTQEVSSGVISKKADSPANKTKANSAKSTIRPSGKVGGGKKRPADEEPAKL